MLHQVPNVKHCEQRTLLSIACHAAAHDVTLVVDNDSPPGIVTAVLSAVRRRGGPQHVMLHREVPSRGQLGSWRAADEWLSTGAIRPDVPAAP